MNPRGTWAATTAYAAGDSFTESGVTYLVVTGYTSGSSFGSTDTGNCCLLLGYGTGNVAQTTYSQPLPSGFNLMNLVVQCWANASSASSADIEDLQVYEIYAQ